MRLTDDDELYYDHPIVFLRNTFEKNWSHGWHVIKHSKNRRKDRKKVKRKANQKARRATKEALRGVRPRVKKRPGDSWDVY